MKSRPRISRSGAKDSKPAIYSFFSGAGFLDLGFEMAGFEIHYVNEVHQPFLDAYRYSRNNLGIPQPVYGYYGKDIQDCLHGDEALRLSDLVRKTKASGQLTGFIGGPPCPDFSVGGKNRGQHGENGKLSQTYVDMICKHLPDFFIFENVKGLYRTSRHREFFDRIKLQLQEKGYSITERLINSIEYGAPQDRERIILFGVHKDTKKHEASGFKWLEYATYPDRSAFDNPWPITDEISVQRSSPKGIPLELTVGYWFERNDVEKHPNAKHQFTPRAGLKKFQVIPEGDDSKKSYKRLHRWRYSPTAAYGNNEVHIHPYLPRRISVAEALAIQSLPKEFSLPPDMTLSNMFKTVGNGVPFLAANALAKSILNFFMEK